MTLLDFIRIDPGNSIILSRKWKTELDFLKKCEELKQCIDNFYFFKLKIFNVDPINVYLSESLDTLTERDENDFELIGRISKLMQLSKLPVKAVAYLAIFTVIFLTLQSVFMGKNPLIFVPVSFIKITVGTILGLVICYLWLKNAVSEAASEGDRKVLGYQLFIGLVISAFFLTSSFIGDGWFFPFFPAESGLTTISFLYDKALVMGMMIGSVLMPVVAYFVHARFYARIERLSKDCMRRINELSYAAKIN